MNTGIKILQNLSEISDTAAELFVKIGNQAILQSDKFTVALAGGSTPKSLYKLLASEKFRSQIDWEKIFFFFGDERNVLPDDEESNFRMAHESLLKPLQIPSENIFRWQTELGDAEKIAEDYEDVLNNFFSVKRDPSADADDSDLIFPRFDLVLLGMGDDGHTASLFPFSNALHIADKMTAANYVEKFDTTRLTFTFPTINSAANIIFLISGEAKAEALKEVLEGKSQPEKFPSQNVKPANGNLHWLVDIPAARLLQ